MVHTDGDESYDSDFRPDLSKHLNRSNQKLLERLGIPPQGQPAPTADGRKAAYWAGAFNDSLESPVLAVSVHGLAPFSTLVGRWFFGVAYRPYVEAHDNPNIAFLEAAEYPAEACDQAIAALSHIAIITSRQ